MLHRRKANRPHKVQFMPFYPEMPCKNQSPECGSGGQCLRCGADQGEACRPSPPGKPEHKTEGG